MTTTATGETVLSAEEVAALPAGRLAPGVADVGNETLVEHEGSHAGLLRLPPGAKLPRHAHSHTAHHAWVVDGAVTVFGRTLTAGAYWFVPPGLAHTLEGAAPDGCTLFYVDVPER